MRFNKHSDLEGKHAFFSASQSSWVNYTEEKMVDRFRTMLAAAHGTKLHAMAQTLITMKQTLPDQKITMNMYVNDCIGFRMTPEQPLKATDRFFGTPDAIRFDEKTKTLRIFDLKTGVNEASFRQLMVYAAFFCMEYDVEPVDIDIELRLYQNDEIRIYEPETTEILFIIDQIKTFDSILLDMQMGIL